MRIHVALLFLIALPQRTPTGGAITKYVPPVPTPASFISDPSGVVASADHAALDAHIGRVQSAGLGDIAVAILPSIGDYSANQVAVEIFRTWKVGSVAAIGSARRDVGVLILIVPKELAPNHRGECWIATGTGAEGILTDATTGAICRDSVIPHLRTKAYAAAVEAGVAGVEARLSADQGLAAANASASAISQTAQSQSLAFTEPSSRVPFMFGGIGIIALLASLVGAQRWRRHHRRKCPRCGRMMQLLDEVADNVRLNHGQDVEEQLGSVDYDVWECECGQTTVLPHRAWFSRYSECRECHHRTASHTRTVLISATTVMSGLAEDAFECSACGATWTQQIPLPQLPNPSSSSGGGSSGGGGGGGSSFGGSGSTSGGGGGGSY
jgi:uncharacterized protein